MPDRSRDSNTIGKLDFPDPSERRPLISRIDSPPASRHNSPTPALEGRFFENVAEQIQARDRKALKQEIIRYSSFAWALVCCLSCGSITAFSLYAPLFQERLRYTQARVNTISIVAELALYLPVPFFGLIADRHGPALLALVSSVFFGLGYFLAAFTYRSGPPPLSGGDGWPFWVMVVAFVGIGMGTSCMYLGAVTTCAKNFGRGKHKGFALAVPIACFGLSGMWQSQIGDRLMKERLADGSTGSVDVFKYFIFLGSLLLACGLGGSVLLRIVDENELIDDAVDELERSGLFQERDFYMPRPPTPSYGTMGEGERRPSTAERDALKARREEERRKKTWLLNEETTRFLSDHTMWWLTAGFFLVTGPGEAFINNIGTVIGTLYPPPAAALGALTLSPTAPSTHVSIIAVSSTAARILSGTLSDIFGPSADAHQHRRGPNSLTSSLASMDPLAASSASRPFHRRRCTISRLTLLLLSTLLLSAGQALLASGAIQNHAHSRLWLVSTLIGTGYGATFSLVPIIISAVWGIENFGTNWGIVAVAPAPGAAVWGAVYAAVYQRGGGADADRCFGRACYTGTFAGMAVASWLACGLWLWAWRGPRGWSSRGVVV